MLSVPNNTLWNYLVGCVEFSGLEFGWMNGDEELEKVEWNLSSVILLCLSAY